jgi:hypothetical protein
LVDAARALIAIGYGERTLLPPVFTRLHRNTLAAFLLSERRTARFPMPFSPATSNID